MQLFATSNGVFSLPSLRFPQKLWNIVNECKSKAIRWGSSGSTIVLNFRFFQEEYLGPGYQYHQNRDLTGVLQSNHGGVWYCLWPLPDLVYYRFFGSLNTKIGVFSMRNWGLALKLAKTTPKRGVFATFGLALQDLV